MSADGKGFPDLLMLRGKRKLIAELKVGDRKTTLEQERWIDAFIAAGVSGYVWRPDSWDEIQSVLGSD